MFGQPLAALGQGLGMGEHLTDAADRTAAEQGMANRQNQGSPDSQFLMLPEGNPGLAVTPPSTEFSTGTTAASQWPSARARNHGPVPALGTSSTSAQSFKVSQGSGGLLAIGSSGTKKGQDA